MALLAMLCGERPHSVAHDCVCAIVRAKNHKSHSVAILTQGFRSNTCRLTCFEVVFSDPSVPGRAHPNDAGDGQFKIALLVLCFHRITARFLMRPRLPLAKVASGSRSHLFSLSVD